MSNHPVYGCCNDCCLLFLSLSLSLSLSVCGTELFMRGFQLVRKLPEGFTTALTRACHLSLSQKKLIQSRLPPASCFLKICFWGTSAELWKVAVIFVMSLHLQQLSPHWTYIQEIWYLMMFRKLSNAGVSDSSNKYFTCGAVHLWYVAELLEFDEYLVISVL